jgi:hypothetical protein
MPKPRKFFSGPWTLVADPPPCDPGNPRRAFAYCEKARHGQRCSCQFELAVIAGDLEDLGLGEYSTEFEDELDADSLADLAADLLTQIRGRQDGSAVRLREELVLLQQLAREGSGVRPVDED